MLQQTMFSLFKLVLKIFRCQTYLYNGTVFQNSLAHVTKKSMKVTVLAICTQPLNISDTKTCNQIHYHPLPHPSPILHLHLMLHWKSALETSINFGYVHLSHSIICQSCWFSSAFSPGCPLLPLLLLPPSSSLS